MPRPFNSDAVLSLPIMAILGKTSRDGARNAPVWFIWENDAVWMLGSTTKKSVMRLQADPR